MRRLAGPPYRSPKRRRMARAELVRRWLRALGPADRHRHQVVVRQHADVGRDTRCATSTRSRSTSTAPPGFALPDDLDVEADVEPVVRAITGPGCHDDGLVRPRLVRWHGTAAEVFDTNGNGGTTAWWTGRIVGGWGQDADGPVQVRLLEDVGRDAKRALTKRAEGADRVSWAACGLARAFRPRCRSGRAQSRALGRLPMTSASGRPRRRPRPRLSRPRSHRNCWRVHLGTQGPPST